MSRSRKTQSFNDVAGKVLRRADKNGKRKGAMAVNAWEAVAGDAIAAHTKGFALRDDGELVIFVDSAAWANQLSLMASELMEGLNKHLGEVSVRSLRFTVSKKVKEGLGAAPQAGIVERDGGEWPEPAALNDIEVAQASRVASVIKNDALREAALRAMTKDLELKKGLRHNAPQKSPKSGRSDRREQGL